MMQHAGGTCPLHVPSSHSLRFKRATVASHRYILDKYLLLEERECHKVVTHTVVHGGSLVEGYWNCAQLKRGKPLKASLSVEEQSPSFNTASC